VEGRIQRHLLVDDGILLDVDPRLESAVSSWVPLASCRSSGADQAASRIFVHSAPLLRVEVPIATPTLRVGSVGVWLNKEPGRAMLGAWLLASKEGNGAGGATHRVRATDDGGVAPSLAIRSVVLREDGVRGSIVVEGLPERDDAAQMEPPWGRHVGSADLAGVLILRSTPPQPTVLVRMPETDLLGALEPESPWLRLDQAVVRGILRAMHGGLRLPTFELRQGLDTYADHARRANVLDGLPHHTTN